MAVPTPGRRVRGSTTGRPVMALLDLLGRRWTLRILWELRKETLTFRQLQETCDQLSPSVLNKRLAELREAQFVELGDNGYRLSSLGADLLSQLLPLKQFATRWATVVEKAKT